MSHLAIRTLIQDTVKSIDRDILFEYARESDFNSIQTAASRRVRLDPLKETVNLIEDSLSFTKTYKVGLIFYKLDSLQGAEKETALILDDMDALSDEFLVRLNRFSLAEDDQIINNEVSSNTIEISSISKDPFIKVLASMLSGFIVQLTITVPNTFNYCSVYES